MITTPRNAHRGSDECVSFACVAVASYRHEHVRGSKAVRRCVHLLNNHVAPDINAKEPAIAYDSVHLERPASASSSQSRLKNLNEVETLHVWFVKKNALNLNCLFYCGK